MPRKIVPPSNEFPYHITARCRNREAFPLPRTEVWALMEDYIFFITNAYQIEILSFVLMDNHLHMLLRDPTLQLSQAMSYFFKETSRYMSSKAGMINQIYGGRFSRSLVSSPHYLHHVYKYVYRNPVEAGLCTKAEDYPHSTLFHSLGRGRLAFPLQPDELLYENPGQTLRWINQTPNPYDTELIERGLRQIEFKISTERRTGRPNRLLTELY